LFVVCGICHVRIQQEWHIECVKTALQGNVLLPFKTALQKVRNPFFLDSESGSDWTLNPV
jgi:hypothetical protein